MTRKHERRVYRATFDPVTADSFRLVILSFAHRANPNAAQLSEIASYS
ncbi:MAG: hypothetical protein NTW21_20020 [Verrucomicrobia bacterium]|nr:hypothetical protein [Verrucomicrobiota bacterium]